jgi:hypothetical protein
MLISTCLLYNRSHWTITKHLWVLSRILTMKEPSSDGPKTVPDSLSRCLIHHVIATCYPKMLRRLGQRTLSGPYIRSLKSVTTFKFGESMSNTATEEMTNDRLLLLFILKSISLHPKIPKLLEQAKLAERREPFQLYTKETCTEFHILLVELLERFQTSLNELKQARGTPDVETQGSDEFKAKVALVMLSGYALLRLARGSAIEMHLKTIAPLLLKTLPPGPHGQEEESEEIVEELKPAQLFIIKEGVPTPVWKSFLDWLRLILAHFDAVDTLVGFVTGEKFQHHHISVKLLVPPPVDQDLLPWQDLFTDATLFPTKSEWHVAGQAKSGKSTKSGKSNPDILDFLNESLQHYQYTVDLKRFWKKQDLTNTVKALRKVNTSQLPGWKECTGALLDKLKVKVLPEQIDQWLQDIDHDIQDLIDSAGFFASLEDTQPFKGALHCEASLASLLSGAANVSKNISNQMKVGYVANLFYH